MITLLIPAFNEAASLGRLLPELPARLHGRQLQPLVIDDGSVDGTADVARRHGTQVISLSSNSGKGASLRAGLRAIRSRPLDAVVLMDADGQHDPRALGRLVGPVLDGSSDVVCGSRYLLDAARNETPLNRYVVRCAVVGYLRRRLRTQLTDPFSGYRCLASDVAARWEPQGDHYEAELELLLAADRNGWVVTEVAVARIYTGDCSKMGAVKGPLLGRLDVLRQYATTMLRDRHRRLATGAEHDPDDRARS